MANVIDIIVRSHDNASRVLADVSRQAGRVNEGLGGMVMRMRNLAAPTLIVGGALAGIGVAAVRMAKDLADTVEQLDNLSLVTGVKVDELQVLQ